MMWPVAAALAWARTAARLGTLLVAIDVVVNGESTPFAVPLALWGAGGLLIDNELRAVIAAPDGIWFPGHEDGPLTHSGDGDPTQIHATGIIGSLPR